MGNENPRGLDLKYTFQPKELMSQVQYISDVIFI